MKTHDLCYLFKRLNKSIPTSNYCGEESRRDCKAEKYIIILCFITLSSKPKNENRIVIPTSIRYHCERNRGGKV
jgi:hypothetical protein